MKMADTDSNNGSMSDNKKIETKYQGLTEEEKKEFDDLSEEPIKGVLMWHDEDVEYMVSTGIVRISEAICNFDLSDYDTDDLMTYLNRVSPNKNHDYAHYAMREHVQRHLFFRLKDLIDLVGKIGVNYHLSFYQVRIRLYTFIIALI